MKPIFSVITQLVIACLPSMVAAQSLSEMLAKFPDKLAVFSNIKRSVDIDIQKGVPYASAVELSEMMILNDKANGMFNKDRVYHSSFNELKKVEAYTLVPDGNSTIKLKVTQFKTQSSPGKGVFYDDVKETTFDYPRMTKGSIAHVETEHYNKDVRFISTFYFNSYLPIANAVYSVTYPEDVEVRYIIKNDYKKALTVKETARGKKKKLEFTASDISDYEHFGDGTDMSYNAPHVIVYVANYKDENKTVPVFGSVDALYKWNVNFLKNINEADDVHLKKVTDSICANKQTDREKAHAIYLWVQNHVKYVAFEAGLEGFIPRQAADVCAKRYGDCKDMASILTAMCRLSGLNAYFTWIGTRSIPYSYKDVPLPITDNHMICAVRLDDSWTFLDATDPHCIFGFPTSGIQGKEALISINPNQYELVTVPTVAAHKNIITDSTFLTIEENTLLGQCSVDYSGYFGSNLFSSLMYNKGEDERVYVKSRMGKGSNKFIMQDYKLQLSTDHYKSANISSHFQIPGYVKSISDEIYINLNLEKLFNNTLIDTSKRKVAIENEFLYTVNQVHTLKLPAGYVAEYVPANTIVSNDLISISIEYTQGIGAITATQKLVLKKLYIQPADFATWNKTINGISPAYKELVVLKKK